MPTVKTGLGAGQYLAGSSSDPRGTKFEGRYYEKGEKLPNRVADLGERKLMQLIRRGRIQFRPATDPVTAAEIADLELRAEQAEAKAARYQKRMKRAEAKAESERHRSDVLTEGGVALDSDASEMVAELAHGVAVYRLVATGILSVLSKEDVQKAVTRMVSKEAADGLPDKSGALKAAACGLMLKEVLRQTEGEVLESGPDSEDFDLEAFLALPIVESEEAAEEDEGEEAPVDPAAAVQQFLESLSDDELLEAMNEENKRIEENTAPGPAIEGGLGRAELITELVKRRV